MCNMCKGWWEGKIKVEVDEVLLLHRDRGDTPLSQRHRTRDLSVL
jgi:hypothetical protein